MTFHVGQKVVCVGTNGTPNIDWDVWIAYYKIVRPERGSIYTVRDIRVGSSGRQFIRVAEIINPLADFIDAPRQEPWWWAEAFRPVIERKTDISIFTAMLKPSKVRA